MGAPRILSGRCLLALSPLAATRADMTVKYRWRGEAKQGLPAGLPAYFESQGVRTGRQFSHKGQQYLKVARP